MNIEVTVFVKHTLLGALKFLQFLFDISVALILRNVVSHSVLVLHCTLCFPLFHRDFLQYCVALSLEKIADHFV